MLNKFKKVLGVIISLIVLYYLALGGQYLLGLNKENKRLHTELIGKTQKYEQLSLHSAKLEIKYKEQSDLRKEAETRFSKELNSLKGRIKVLSNATFLIREEARKSNNSDIVYQGDRVKFVLNEIRFKNGPAVGYVLIFDDGRVVSKLYNHIIDVNTLVARDEKSGSYDIVSKANYVLKSPSININGESNWFNRPFPLNIVGGQAIVDPTESNKLTKRFFLLNPQLNANLNVYGSNINPGLGVSLMSRGYTKRDSDFKFISFGLDYNKNKDLGPTLIPIMWRPLPSYLTNTYIGPGISYIDNDFKYFMGVQIGL